MKDIFNDPKFESFLYGGVRDLDEPVGQLVYNLWKSEIQTTGSCSGHIAAFLEDGGGSSIGGYLAYQPGTLFYMPKNAERLTARLEDATEKYPFAELRKNKEFTFYLEMQDVSTNFKGFERGIARVQVTENEARERYAQFLQIWKELTTWSQKLN